MSWRVRLTRAAEEDLRKARRWYREQAAPVDLELRREVREALQRIAENPLQYPDVHRGVRRALVHRFPYSIFYRARAETIKVIAVTQQAQDPEIWKKRS